MLAQIHETHQGLVKSRAVLQEITYWRLMNNDLDQLVKNCEVCQVFQPSQRAEPLQSYAKPLKRPMQLVSANPYKYGGKKGLSSNARRVLRISDEQRDERKKVM